MQRQDSLRLWLEIIWWTITAIVAFAVLRPIGQATANYPFFWLNLCFIVAAFTLTRYAFQIEHAFFSKMQGVKIGLTIALLPLIFVLTATLNGFISWIGDNQFTPITGHLPEVERLPMERFIWGEMLFFGIASILAAGAFLVRVVISIWRTHNLGKA